MAELKLEKKESKATDKELNSVIESYRQSHKSDFYWVAGLFLAGASIFVILYYTVPSARNVSFTWKFSGNIEDIRVLAGVAEKYYQSNPTYVPVLFVYLYIFLQTFGVPGPAVLGIIGGTLFRGFKGFILANMCAPIGACTCYYLSSVIAKSIILKYFQDS